MILQVLKTFSVAPSMQWYLRTGPQNGYINPWLFWMLFFVRKRDVFHGSFMITRGNNCCSKSDLWRLSGFWNFDKTLVKLRYFFVKLYSFLWMEMRSPQIDSVSWRNNWWWVSSKASALRKSNIEKWWLGNYSTFLSRTPIFRCETIVSGRVISPKMGCWSMISTSHPCN